MEQNCIQLEMNFNGAAGNRMRDNFNNGKFEVLVELNAPTADNKLEDAVSRYEDLEYLTQSQKELNCGIAFTDQRRTGGCQSLDLVSFATALCKTNRDRHLLYLNGRDMTYDKVHAMLAHAASEGFKNVCAVSGASIPGENAQQTSKHRFLESVNQLNYIRKNMPGKFYCGCAVNPFKYTLSDQCTQMYKLVKKVNYGAEFVVTQFGWDMLKLQELHWNMRRRSLHIPLVARLLMLTPDQAEEICAGSYPGVHISPDFQIALRRETVFSRAQFDAAQLRRIQLHAAGASLLGYSGIQIAGVESLPMLDSVLKRIAEALHEFQSFDEWREVYGEYYAHMDMAPYPNRYYCFENLFQTKSTDEEPKVRDVTPQEPGSGEMMRLKIGKALFSHAHELPAAEKRLTKKVLFSCHFCDQCRLPLTDYICPETCPKGMANGPCGCSKANGDCEFSDHECMFAKRMRLAAAENCYTSLEDTCIEPPEPKAGTDKR